MILKWFSTRDAADAGTMLADGYVRQTGSSGVAKLKKRRDDEALQQMLVRADREVRPLRLNLYKRAKFANSFKWRLLENGFEAAVADELTHVLVMHLFMKGGAPQVVVRKQGFSSDANPPVEIDRLLNVGNRQFEKGAYVEAAACYQELLNAVPIHVEGLNNLGAALCKLGRYQEAEVAFRRAIDAKPDYPDPHSNLGNVLRWTGRIGESEVALRRAIKLKPNFVDARASLGLTLVLLGRIRDARARFEKVLKTAPQHVDALFGMGQIARIEGRFDDAVALFNRLLEANPTMPNALAALAGIGKRTKSDADWLEKAESAAASGLPSMDEADLRFAIGKYYDDTEDYGRAFASFKRANELLRATTSPYSRKDRERFVDDMVRIYSGPALARASEYGSLSETPIFVVGMMRSGTSLAEQILSSHPSAKGAGELAFWSDAVRVHEATVRERILDEETKRTLAEAYLKVLTADSAGAVRIIDKAPVNSDHLGVIHTVFPKARIIYMERDPLDSCLSCYFQQFSNSLNFTMDLSDLAHYYREHHRLMEHWRTVLPPGTILDVPYAGLVNEQEAWTRKMLDFVGLPWDARCLDFYSTPRSVVTASYWQVRQKIYRGSVGRWVHYEKFIKPLLTLKNFESAGFRERVGA